MHYRRLILAGLLCLAAATAPAQFVEIPLLHEERAYLACHTIFNVKSAVRAERYKTVVTVCDWIAPVVIFLEGTPENKPRDRMNVCWDYLSPEEFTGIRRRIQENC